jgi:hypothetical protein
MQTQFMTTIHEFTTSSINGPSVIHHLIRKQERIHWFLGLQQAEREIASRSSALEAARFSIARSDNNLARLRSRLDKVGDEFDRRDIEIDIAEIEAGRVFLDIQIRDAILELASAQYEFSRIKTQHSTQLECFSFGELQDVCGSEALQAKQSFILKSNHLALECGESFAANLMDLDPSHIAEIAAQLSTFKILNPLAEQ